jgi:hypothetical protein
MFKTVDNLRLKSFPPMDVSISSLIVVLSRQKRNICFAKTSNRNLTKVMSVGNAHQVRCTGSMAIPPYSAGFSGYPALGAAFYARFEPNSF